MAFPYATPDNVKHIAVEKNERKFPNSDHVVTQADIDAGIYDEEFKGANWIHGTLYSYCYVNGKPQEYNKWLVLGNDPDTTSKAMYHSIPERDKDGVLYSWCVKPNDDWQHNYDYMLVNTGYLHTLVPNIRKDTSIPVPAAGTTVRYELVCDVENDNGKKKCTYKWVAKQ